MGEPEPLVAQDATSGHTPSAPVQRPRAITERRPRIRWSPFRDEWALFTAAVTCGINIDATVRIA